MHVEGYHASVFLLGPGHQTTYTGWVQHCMQLYLERFHECKSGLANSYIALVADTTLRRVLSEQVGLWQPLCQYVYKTPRPRKRRKNKNPNSSPAREIQYDLTPLENLLRALEAADVTGDSGNASPKQNHSLSSVADQLHSLLDNPPWKPGDHALVDVHWLLGDNPLPSPSVAVSLSGALLRLKVWHKMHLQIVTCNDSGEKDSSVFQEWVEMVEARVCTLDDWSVGVGTIWRGSLHFTEHRSSTKQASRQTVVFPGFALTLQPEEEELPTEAGDCLAILRDVGLAVSPPAQPTHLEVVQIIDTTTLPFIWLSPLQCSLSLTNSLHADSKRLLREVFKGKNTGLLVRLCFGEESKTATQHRTTADWHSYIQSLEEAEFSLSELAKLAPQLVIHSRSSPSPLAAYEPGPLLLVCPSDQSELRAESCDAWFLWKPEAINPEPFLQLQTQPLEIKSNPEKLRLALPVIDITNEARTSDPQVLVCDLSAPHLLQDLHNRAAGFKQELDPPSEWPEIRALRTYEWIQRKLVRRLTTPDLMFGQMVAPPPASSEKSGIDADDVLRCFHDTGSPATSELSPITSDISEVVKMHNPASEDTVPSFEAISTGTPRSKKRYHGVNYCLLPEDSMMDSRLTRIQQRYLISERASNCSSSNTPEVKLEQRRRKRRASETKTQQEQEKAVKKRDEATSANTSRDARGEKSPLARPMGEESGNTDSSSSSSRRIKFSKSPVVKLHRIQTPPSAGMPRALSQALGEKTGREKQQDSSETVAINPPPGDPAVPNAVSADQAHPTDSSSAVPGPSTVTCKLRRSPRKNKWVVGKSAAGSSGSAGEDKQVTTKVQTRKKKLEQIIVAALKKKGLQRSHDCFRKCYNRLFTLSKSFLKDLRDSKILTEEMHRVVDFNVSQVIEFELRQAKLSSELTTES